MQRNRVVGICNCDSDWVTIEECVTRFLAYLEEPYAAGLESASSLAAESTDAFATKVTSLVKI